MRGSVNALAADRPADVTASGGNHGIGVATAAACSAARHGLPAGDGARGEDAADRGRGGTVIRDGATYAEAEAAARRAAGARRAVRAGLRRPGRGPGQGTVGLEAAAQAPDCDAVVVAVGGGGLASAGLTVVGVEADGCACLHAAVAAGGRWTPRRLRRRVGARRDPDGGVPFDILRRAQPVLALVSDAEFLAAQDRLWEEFRLAVEPAGAAPFAAWLAGRVSARACVLVICGANVG